MRRRVDRDRAPAPVDDALHEGRPARRVRAPAVQQQHAAGREGGLRSPFVELQRFAVEIDTTPSRHGEQRCIDGVELAMRRLHELVERDPRGEGGTQEADNTKEASQPRKFGGRHVGQRAGPGGYACSSRAMAR